MKVFEVKSVRELDADGTLSVPSRYTDKKTGPFQVLQISAWATADDTGHSFLIQDGTKVRTLMEHQVEVATPLTEALV